MSSQPLQNAGAHHPSATEPDFKYYRPPGASASLQRLPELPDAYFEPSTIELKAAQASLSARASSLTNAPLRTQAMRDAESRTKQARWPYTTIRVKFSDRSQLEKTFPSTDKIKSVYAFVRGSLRDNVKPIKFVLYQTPPKREFKVSDPTVRDLTLFELQLAPSSVLLLRFEDDALNHPDVAAPLNQTIIGQAVDLPAPPNFDVEPASKKVPPEPSSNPSSRQTSSQPGGKEQKLAKFLKLGPKK